MAASSETPSFSPIAVLLVKTGCRSPKNTKVNTRRQSKSCTFSKAARDEVGASRAEVPGPGTYSEHDGFVWQHESISKRGYTAGFASHAPRLDTGFRYTGPGPGAYKAPQWGDKLYSSSKTCTIASPPTSKAVLLAAVKQQRRVLQRLNKASVPPVGQYSTNRSTHGATLDWKAASECTSAFQATARPPLRRLQDQPAPGTYEADLRWGQEEQSHTNFKLQPGHSQQQKAAQHGSLPPVLTSDKPAKAAAAPAWCSSEVTPGPGYYDTQPSTDVEARPDKPAVAFGATGDGKHGSAVTAIEPPGPGAYEPTTGNELAHKVLSKNLGPSSPFRSTTARSVMFSQRAMLNKPPGPAFYKPHLPLDHRSFHFGAVKDSFVPAGAGMSDLDLTKQRVPVSSN